MPPVDTKFIQLRVDTNFIFQVILNPFWNHWLSLQSEWLSALRFIHSLSLSHWEWGIKRKQPIQPHDAITSRVRFRQSCTSLFVSSQGHLISSIHISFNYSFTWTHFLFVIRSEGNKAYFLQMGSEKVLVYCHMTSLSACGGGGWTLVALRYGVCILCPIDIKSQKWNVLQNWDSLRSTPH